MARSSQSMLGYVRSWLAGSKGNAGTDGELLARFVVRRDEAAFAELLNRHGPMILGLCRRLVGDNHLAEDVFQASFLVLARRSDSIRRPESLGAWLYGVAYRLALKARARQRRQEPQTLPDSPANGPDPLEELSARELLAIIDGELHVLPEAYRLPLIHCCLEGRSLEETAQLLGWTVGSVKGRLERGRSRLRSRLARHGLTLPAVLGPTLFLAPPALAAPLLSSTLSYARGIAARPVVTAIAEEGLRTVLASKSRMVWYASLAAGLAGIGIGLSVWSVHYTAQHTGNRYRQPVPDALTMSREIPLPAEILINEAPAPNFPERAIARLGTDEHRHPLAKSIAFRPDGTAVLTMGDDGIVRTWDPGTGRLLAQTAQPGERHLDQMLSHDGKVLMRMNGNRLEFWRLGPQATMSSLEFSDLKKAALAPDGNAFATIQGAAVGNSLFVHTREPASSRSMGEIASYPGDLIIAPEGKRVFTSLAIEGWIRCWDGLQDGPAWANRIAAAKIAISNDGKWLIVNPDRRGAHFMLLDARTGKQANEHPLPRVNGYWNATVSPDGRLFCCTGDRGALVWDISEGKPAFLIAGEAHDAAFSPDGKTLAVISGGIHVYDVATGKPVFQSAIDNGHTTPVMGICWSSDGKRLVSYAMQGRNHALLWEVNAAGPRRIDNALGTIAAARFAPDGKNLTLLSFDGQVHIADGQSGKEITQRVLVEPADGRAFELSLASDASRAALLFDRGEHESTPQLVWIEPFTGMTKRSVSLPQGLGRKVMITDDGRALFNPRGDQFDSDSRQLLPPLQLPPQHSLDEKAVCSANGERIAIALMAEDETDPNRNGVAVWERKTGKLVRVTPARAHQGNIAISPDGEVLAVGELNRVVLWEVATGEELARLELPPRPELIDDDWLFDAISFSPDGRRIATGHFDSTILIWEVPKRKKH